MLCRSEKNIFRVPLKDVECAVRKKRIAEASVTAVMCLHRGAKTKEKVRTHLSEDIEVNAGVYQGSALSRQLSAIVIDIVW